MSGPVMRVVTVRVRPNDVPAWLASMRSTADANAASTPGLLSLMIGVSMAEGDAVGCVTSLWESVEALEAAIGSGWGVPVVPDGLAQLHEPIEVRHYADVGVWPGPAQGLQAPSR